jgi:ABC-type multidrug transport system fused ATPase/permease subunit
VGLTEPICPECGRGFDPHNPATWNDLSKSARWFWWYGPPGRVFNGYIVFVTVSLVFMASAGGPEDWTGIFGVVAFFCAMFTVMLPVPLVILVAFFIRVVVTYKYRKIWGADVFSGKRNNLWRWSTFPVCIAISISLLLWPWSMYLRFTLSRSAFDQAAQQVLSGAPVPRG